MSPNPPTSAATPPPSKLFTPLAIGRCALQHRIVMAPMARFRATASHAPTPIMATYYAQRACAPGTMLVAEASLISPRAGGQAFGPGMWTAEHFEGWRRVTDAVHARGGHIWAQLFAMGRATPRDGDGWADGFVSASAVAMGEGEGVPRELNEEEIWGFVGDWAEAARGAVERAGFDGVEIHGAHGYLIDQFTQDTCNRRVDAWGGSIEKRARFALEVVRAVMEAVGPERTGVRLSPWSIFQGMGMADPVPQFTYLIKQLRSLDIAYVHLVSLKISGDKKMDRVDPKFAVEAWGKGKPILIAGGLEPELARRLADQAYPQFDIAAVFGRFFLSTPDLVFRIQKGIDLNPYDRNTFYGDGKRAPELGYTDYPFSDEFFHMKSMG